MRVYGPSMQIAVYIDVTSATFTPDLKWFGMCFRIQVMERVCCTVGAIII